MSHSKNKIIGFRKIRGKTVPIYEAKNKSDVKVDVNYKHLSLGVAATVAGVVSPALAVTALKKASINYKIASVLGISAATRWASSDSFDRYAKSLHLPRKKERRVKNFIASAAGVFGTAWGIKKIVGK